jgi:hypothetical protein
MNWLVDCRRTEAPLSVQGLERSVMSRAWIRWSGCLGVVLMGCVGSISNKAKQTSDGDGDGQDPPGLIRADSGTDGDGTGDGDLVTPDGGMVQQPKPPPPRVNDCNGLAAEGVFEEITPPEVTAGLATTDEGGGGTFAMAVDQINQGTLYVGTRTLGVWKSTDCGSTWKHITTGRNGKEVDRGMNWTFMIDPIDPEVVYTNSGYGSNDLYKSVNGGVDWDVIWPPPGQPELAKAFVYNFANVIAIDPSNHQHILLTFHEACLAPHQSTCIAETFDGGTSWTLLDGRPGWDGREGQVIFFLENSRTWLWGSQSNGFWRSGDSGTSWEEIPGMTTSHLQSSQMIRAGNGMWYVAAADGIWRSPDGLASNWKLIPGTGPIIGGLQTNGTNMFASTCYFPNFCPAPRYLRSAESDGLTWTALPNSPKLNMGGTMGYDKAHNILYTSNLRAGLWRVVAR